MDVCATIRSLSNASCLGPPDASIATALLGLHRSPNPIYHVELPVAASQARNDDWMDVRQSLDLWQPNRAAAWSKDIPSDGPLGIGEIRLRTSEALFVVSKCRPVKGPLSTGTRASQGAS